MYNKLLFNNFYLIFLIKQIKGFIYHNYGKYWRMLLQSNFIFNLFSKL